MPYIRNKRTGEVMEVDASGRPMGRAPQMPVDPTFQYKGEGAALDNQAKRANISNDAERVQIAQQQLALQQQQAAIQQQLEGLKLTAAQKEEEEKSSYNPRQIEAAKNDAMAKLQTIDRIGENYQDAWLPAIGFGAETATGIGGTNASNIKTALEELKAGGALSEVMKMTQATGKTPFTPMSNSDVDLISKNIAGVSQSQSPKDFFRAIQPYRRAYVNAYAGAVGAETLNREVAAQLEKYRRENPNRTPAQDQRFQSVLQAQGRQLYEQRMRQPGRLKPPPPRKPSRVIDFNDLP